MSAETLREAAGALRGLVEQAQCPCGGPACGPEKWFHFDELDARFDGSASAVPLILAMNPSVALALAEWLDATASRIDLKHNHGWRGSSEALEVARAIFRALP